MDIVTLFFTLGYGAACGVSAFSPRLGLLILLGISLIPMFYFLAKVLQQMLIGAIVTLVCTALAVAVATTVILAWLAPFIELIPIIWAAFTLVSKFSKFAKALPYALGSIALYGFYSLSFLKSNQLIAQTETTTPFLVYLVSILMAGIGIGLMLLLLEIYHRYGRKKLMAAFYMVGFSWYITIFIIKLIIPGDDAEDSDHDVEDTYPSTNNHKH